MITRLITKDNIYHEPYDRHREEDFFAPAPKIREIFIDEENSISTSINSDVDLYPPTLEHARQMQNTKRFITTESELMEECGRTNRVQYIRPKPWERDRRVTQNRRRQIWKALKRHAKRRHIKGLANKHIADPRFKEAEARLKEECRLTSGARKVKHEPPSPTEMAAETRVRRQRLRRKLHKYYGYLAERSYSFVVAKTYALLLAPASARRAVEESTKVDCVLGPKKCPCRGLKWDHIFFTWRRVDDSEKLIEDEVKKFWGRCPECHNGYDKRFGGRGMDLIVSYCAKQMCTLQKAAEADEDVFTTGEKLKLSPAEIMRGLIPKMRRLIDERMLADNEEEVPDESLAQGAANLMNKWLGKRHSKFLAFIKEDDEDFRAWLEASTMRFSPVQRAAK